MNPNEVWMMDYFIPWLMSASALMLPVGAIVLAVKLTKWFWIAVPLSFGPFALWIVSAVSRS
jgi:hypothetical protein